jgi:hypothetical protein
MDPRIEQLKVINWQANFGSSPKPLESETARTFEVGSLLRAGPRNRDQPIPIQSINDKLSTINFGLGVVSSLN